MPGIRRGRPPGSVTVRNERSERKIDPLPHIGLVHKIAAAYQGRGFDFDDLAQEGWMGLLLACERFDASRGHKFSTYAALYIKGYIRHALRTRGQRIRVPVHVAAHLARVDSGRVRLSDLTEEIRLNVVAARRLRRARVTNRDDVLAEIAGRPDQGHEIDGHRAELRRLLPELPPGEREMLRCWLDLAKTEEPSHGKVAAKLGYTRQRAQQLFTSAVARLQQRIEIARRVEDRLDDGLDRKARRHLKRRASA